MDRNRDRQKSGSCGSKRLEKQVVPDEPNWLLKFYQLYFLFLLIQM